MARHQHHKGNADSQTLSPSQGTHHSKKSSAIGRPQQREFAESLPFELDDFQTEANDALEAGQST